MPQSRRVRGERIHDWQPIQQDPLGPEQQGGVATRLPLSALLSQVLVAFTIDFERESHVSLPISANALRVLDEKGVRVRDLPRLTGVSKEAISMLLGFLERHHYLVVERDPTDSRTKLARLTPQGLQAQDAYHQLPDVIEERWQARFGKDDIHNLRESLERLVSSPKRTAVAFVQGVGALLRRVAGVAPQGRHAAALSHGPAPRRVS